MGLTLSQAGKALEKVLEGDRSGRSGDPHDAATILGKAGGEKKSAAKTAAARLNGTRGGRPKK